MVCMNQVTIGPTVLPYTNKVQITLSVLILLHYNFITIPIPKIKYLNYLLKQYSEADVSPTHNEEHTSKGTDCSNI